ncbi:hypothetical protein MGG_16036 [Pyricularia oryzae 70-15]|uniref:Uncharacterized protein n=1 Tax=Pyricularia oryzae (strain 70-15 / ATCC MYA-4617 / FGSC 8958) TaxID=242507 RepID=G4MNS4_PYRO7|nr:uncharacterized protein MGG_16036 [Pyricularia oryzae 70-15]EHA56290.1 hypothetical protein MGG_16036 [Pyricularia oryzae 70-15]
MSPPQCDKKVEDPVEAEPEKQKCGLAEQPLRRTAALLHIPRLGTQGISCCSHTVRYMQLSCDPSSILGYLH